jgi:hypothetical protein
MKWKTIKLDDRKTVKRFAFLPTELESGMTVWLEFYKIDLIYRNIPRRVRYHGISVPRHYPGWHCLRKYQ